MAKILYGVITAALAGTDLWCKSYAEEHIEKGEEKEILGGKVVLRKAHNKGMAMNVGEKRPEIVRAISGIACVLIGIYSVVVWFKDRCPWKKLGAALTLAGAISNTCDRFARKYVVDYFGFKTKWEKLNRITFNLADMFIFLGSGVLFVAGLSGCKRSK